MSCVRSTSSVKSAADTPPKPKSPERRQHERTDGRRRLLDQGAGRLRALATAERQEFERVLRQRTGLLKAAASSQRALATLDVWDESFARAGAVLVRNRLAVRRLADRTEVVGDGFVPEEAQGAVDVDGRRRECCESAVAPHLDHDERLIGAELRFPLNARVLWGLEQSRGGILPPEGEPFAGKIGERCVVPTDAYLHGVEA